MNKQLATNLFFATLLLAILYGIVYIFFLKSTQEPIVKNNGSSSTTTQANNQNFEGSSVQSTTTEIKTDINKNKHMITIKTNLGNITFETFDSDAPKTVQNFVTLANKGFYDGIIFHRVIKGFMIQGGDPTGTGTGGPGYQFADELNPTTASYKNGYKKGIVAMANAGPNTNGSQFFIMLADYPLPNNYTIFGRVVSGQEVVDAIGNLSTGAQDRPVNPPVMEKVTVQ